MYWELRFDEKLLSRKTLGLLRDVANGDYSDCDAHLTDRVPTRILDFSFNKQVFNQLLAIQSLLRWQKFWDKVASTAWPLGDAEVREFTDRSMCAIFSLLQHQEDSRVVTTDPTGQERLKAARRLRIHFRRRLRNNRPPETGKVLMAAECFAREPFHSIDADDHKIT
jgi:hypothetical protein